LVNLALDHLGVDSIASLDENSTAARKARTQLDTSIESVLARSDWSFARRVSALAEVENTVWPQRHQRAYDLPSDLLAARYLVEAVDRPNRTPVPFSLANGLLYTDAPEAILLYTYRNTTTTAWPQPFVDAVAAYLARQLTVALTRKRNIWREMHDLYELLLAQAVSFDAGQEPTSYAYPSDYLDARGPGGSHFDSRGADGSTYWS
jgi:hypothetical protein